MNSPKITITTAHPASRYGRPVCLLEANPPTTPTASRHAERAETERGYCDLIEHGVSENHA